MDDLLVQMGKRIQRRRKQLRMTQDELAESAGITTQTVSTAERGEKALRPENIVRIAVALEVSTDYLLLGELTGTDYSILSTKISNLSLGQYHHLEDIINSYIATIQEMKREK